MMQPEVLIAFGGVGVNLLALLIAVGRIVSSGARAIGESEARITDRLARIETKTERAERDIQQLFKALPKRASERNGNTC